MAKRKSAGGGIAIVGLIIIALLAKYWYLVVAGGVVVLVAWGIAKIIQNQSTPKTSVKRSEARNEIVSGKVIETPRQNAKCAFCNTVGLHPILKITEKTIDCKCFACGKNFFVFKTDSNRINTNNQSVMVPDISRYEPIQRNSVTTENQPSPKTPEPPPETKNLTVPTVFTEAPKQNAKCAFCNTVGLHPILKITEKTVDCKCFACGKNFFIFKLDSGRIITNSTDSNRTVSSETIWVPCGRTFQHAGYTIPGGLIYLGTGLKSIQGWGEEPALIDPTLPVDSTHPDREGLTMSYWPSYSQISPASRAGFLEWLSSGRNDPKICIGYVFIYFYGLERRALADAKESVAARNDLPVIMEEVKRLLSIYRGNNSFKGYASRFMDLLQVLQTSAPLYRASPQIEYVPWEIPLTLKVALGQIARDGIPLPAEWALAWAANDPSMPRRMPLQRCPEEFGELFKIRYVNTFGEGLKLKVNKTLIKAGYRPASSSFGGDVETSVSDLPDITRLTGPSSKISDIVNICTDELEGYSRYLGRNPDGRSSIEATSYLPHQLLNKYAGKEFQNLYRWLAGTSFSDAPLPVSFSSLLEQIPSIKPDGFGKKEATAVASLLGKMNIGIEPDPRFVNFIPKPEQQVVLFRISDNAPNSSSAEYSAATVVLHLASAVAAADGTVDVNEERHLLEHLESWLHLSADEKSRLQAHTQWLLSSFPGMNGVKKRIELLKQDQRESLGRFLVGVAQSDGYIDPAELKMLTKIYEMLGLDAQSLYSHAHAAAVGPVTVQAADFTKPQGYVIPSPPQKTVEGISLDMDSIRAKLAETVAVSDMLKNIFTEESLTQPPATASKSIVSDVTIAGLDTESFAFMQVLASKLVWARDELEKLADDYNLMLDGTLDSINDASFDHFGGPFFEGDDPIEIDPEMVNRLEGIGAI